MRKHINSITVTRPSHALTYVDIECDNVHASMPILFTADRHWDNPKSDQKMQKKHLDWAVENGALIVDVGDLFCAMQGAGDPRGSKSDIRPEHMTGRYLNSLSSTAADYFKPYAKQFLALFYGNHETSVIKKKEYDLTERLAHDLSREGSDVQKMGYSGYIRLNMRRKNSGDRKTFTIYCNHGSGGGGIVTKGVIQTNRRAVFVADADLVVSGHIHEAWMLEVPKERINQNHVPVLETQVHLQLPTYKEEYMAHEGYHIEKGGPPKPLGAWAVHFEFGGGGLKSMSPQRLH